MKSHGRSVFANIVVALMLAISLPAYASRLTDAVSNGDSAEVRRLIDQGADVETPSLHSESPLYIAAKKGHTEIARLLLNANADINKAHDAYQTPLFTAAEYGHIDVVKLLLEAKANVEPEREIDIRLCLQ